MARKKTKPKQVPATPEPKPLEVSFDLRWSRGGWQQIVENAYNGVGVDYYTEKDREYVRDEIVSALKASIEDSAVFADRFMAVPDAFMDDLFRVVKEAMLAEATGDINDPKAWLADLPTCITRWRGDSRATVEWWLEKGIWHWGHLQMQAIVEGWSLPYLQDSSMFREPLFWNDARIQKAILAEWPFVRDLPVDARRTLTEDLLDFGATDAVFPRDPSKADEGGAFKRWHAKLDAADVSQGKVLIGENDISINGAIYKLGAKTAREHAPFAKVKATKAYYAKLVAWPPIQPCVGYNRAAWEAAQEAAVEAPQGEQVRLLNRGAGGKVVALLKKLGEK